MSHAIEHNVLRMCPPPQVLASARSPAHAVLFGLVSLLAFAPVACNTTEDTGGGMPAPTPTRHADHVHRHRRERRARDRQQRPVPATHRLPRRSWLRAAHARALGSDVLTRGNAPTNSC